MGRSGRVAVSLVLLLAAGACDGPRPSASDAPGPSDAASPTEPGPTPPIVDVSPVPLPPVGEAPPTSVELIEAAVEAGTIDRTTGFLYRFYAQWGDGRLPETYQGEPSEDDVLAIVAEAAVPTLAPDQQALLRPFLLRPSHPDSYWSSDAVGATGMAQLASFVRPVVAAVCTDGWSRLDVATIPVTIWGHCRADPSGVLTVPLSAAVAKVEGFVTSLWPDMTALMQVPIPDKFKNGRSQGADEPIEAGDGRLDIYIVEGPRVPYERDLTVMALARTFPVAPKTNGTSSAYMVIDPTRPASDAAFKSTVAHELFHVLADRYNSDKKYFCAYPNVAATCPVVDSAHWFSEASAVWAEHHFVPEARQEAVYDTRYQAYLRTPLSLADTSATNPYRSFIWPLFMEQEAAAHDRVIRSVWDAWVGRSTWTTLQSAVNAVMPFNTAFRDFAVRVWNEDLQPGDPVRPQFQAYTPNFPPWSPPESSPAPRWRDSWVLAMTPSPIQRFTEDIPELWASYYDLAPAPEAKRLTLNFAGLSPNGNLDVDALVRLRDGSWERRELDPLVTEWCLEEGEKAIEQITLVLSNHSDTPADHIRGTWTAQVEEGGCLVARDVLVYRFTQTQGGPGQGVFNTHTESLILTVSLTSNDGASGFAADFLNDGSSFSASVSDQGVIETFEHQCDQTSTGGGGDGGVIQEPDGVVANLTQVFEPPLGGPTLGPEGRWTLTVGASVTVQVTTTLESCLGTSSGVSERIIMLPSCSGDEIIDSIPARTFDFNCSQAGPGLNWSVTGRVTIG